MPSKQPEGKHNTSSSTEVAAAPPVPQEFGATVSVVSSIFSVIALIISGLSFNRSKRLEKSSRFETAYGSPLRSHLRLFEKQVLKLRAFVFPSGKTVDEMKTEIETLRVELEVSSNELGALLKELDDAQTVESSNWFGTFHELVSQAEVLIQSSSHQSVIAEMSFRTKIEQAQQKYQQSIKDVREILDGHRAKI